MPEYIIQGKKKEAILHFLLKSDDPSPFIQSLKHTLTGTHAHKEVFQHFCYPHLLLCSEAAAFTQTFIYIHQDLHIIIQNVTVNEALNMYFNGSLKNHRCDL